MTDNVISIKEWKAKHRPERRKVPVYHVVSDPNGGYRLELVEELELVEWLELVELDGRVHLSADES
jgi:hypothetical protein